MASPGMPSLFGVGWLCAVAMVTSLLWYAFWMVMSPVEEDVSPLINWYLFMKLRLGSEVDLYGILKVVHNWLPLVVITAFILSKVSFVYRSSLFRVSQLVYVFVISYNGLLLVFMLYSGRKVVQLFLVTLPLYLMVHCGTFLSPMFSPHLLWLPTALCCLLYCFFCRHLPTSDKRQYRSCGLWELTAVGATKRVVGTFLIPVLLTCFTCWIMGKGCHPCSSTPGFNSKTTPSKPLLVGHRGCAFDSPENSIAAFELAVVVPRVVGLETDVSISMDGIPYLIHDPHLIRTSDVLKKCPSQDLYANSNLLQYYNGTCPLGKLNVGTAFLAAGRTTLTPEEVRLFGSQQLPTFRQFLDVAVHNGMSVMFDVSEPPVGHPHHHCYLNTTLEDIVASGLPHHKVWWLPNQGRQWVHQNYPNFVQTTKTELTPFEDLQVEHIQKINDDWSTPLQKLRQYQRQNISINMFFVESPFMFSYAWCVGVETVTTSNCKRLSQLHTNTFLQICRSWYAGSQFSQSLLLGGLSLVLLQVVVLVCWETLRVTGYWPHTVKR